MEPKACLNCVSFTAVEAKCGLCCGPTSEITKYERIVYEQTTHLEEQANNQQVAVQSVGVFGVSMGRRKHT